MDEAGDGKGGGGGAGDDKNKPDPAKEVETLKASNAALLARLEALEGKKKTEDDDLLSKTKQMNESYSKSKVDQKALESALTFGLKSEEFLKNNASLLPKEAADLFKAADKESYDSPIQKANAIKSGIIQTFFQQQANMDLLTSAQKQVVDEYLKLTKTGKEEKAQHLFDTVFEPTLETLRRIKKAEIVSKGYGSGSDAENAYKQKLMNLSKKHYLGDKSNA